MMIFLWIFHFELAKCFGFSLAIFLAPSTQHKLNNFLFISPAFFFGSANWAADARHHNIRESTVRPAMCWTKWFNYFEISWDLSPSMKKKLRGIRSQAVFADIKSRWKSQLSAWIKKFLLIEWVVKIHDSMELYGWKSSVANNQRNGFNSAYKSFVFPVWMATRKAFNQGPPIHRLPLRR